MQQITQRLTTVIWYGPLLSLVNATWKGSVNIVRLINPAGTGYTSFDPLQGLNSLSQVVAGQVLIVDALPAAFGGTGFALDNGSSVVNTQLKAGFPAGGVSSVKATITVAEAGTYIVDANNPTTGVVNIAYMRNNQTVGLPIALANGDVLLMTGTTMAGTDGLLTLIKQ